MRMKFLLGIAVGYVLGSRAGRERYEDIVAVEGPDTFVRPIYAGSVLATVRSADAI